MPAPIFQFEKKKQKEKFLLLDGKFLEARSEYMFLFCNYLI